MAYCQRHDEMALQEVANHVGCGKIWVFIDRNHPYLGASTNGLIDDNLLVEIKCPSSAKDMSPGEAIKKRKVTF